MDFISAARQDMLPDSVRSMLGGVRALEYVPRPCWGQHTGPLLLPLADMNTMEVDGGRWRSIDVEIIESLRAQGVT